MFNKDQDAYNSSDPEAYIVWEKKKHMFQNDEEMKHFIILRQRDNEKKVPPP